MLRRQKHHTSAFVTELSLQFRKGLANYNKVVDRKMRLRGQRILNQKLYDND